MNEKMKLMVGIALLLAGALTAAADEYPAYFYWNVSDSVADFSYAQLRLSGGDTYFKIGDTDYTMVGAETTGGATLGQATGTVAANLGSFATSDYSFLVEVFGEDDGLLAYSDAMSYDQLYAGGFIYADMSSIATGASYGVSVSNVPEPTSGCLFLLGLAALALRRKRQSEKLRVKSEECGKRCVCFLLSSFFILTSSLLFGAANDVVLTFSTSGPDTYADGTGVVDGESYALIWTKNGSTFGGISSDGSLLSADDRLVLVAGVAEAGRCPTTVFEIDAEDAANYNGGTFALYLLDTRIRDADGKVAVAGANALATTAPKAVNAIGVAATTSSSAESSPSPRTFTSATAVALAAVGVYAKIDPPTITALKIENGKVSISVEGTSDAAEYFVVPGERPDKFATALDAKNENGVFTFDQPKDASFFKVVGVRKFK